MPWKLVVWRLHEPRPPANLNKENYFCAYSSTENRNTGSETATLGPESALSVICYAREFAKSIWEMSSQLFVTLYTLSIYPSSQKQLSRHLPNPSPEFPCIMKWFQVWWKWGWRGGGRSPSFSLSVSQVWYFLWGWEWLPPPDFALVLLYSYTGAKEHFLDIWKK